MYYFRWNASCYIFTVPSIIMALIVILETIIYLFIRYKTQSIVLHADHTLSV